MSQDETSLMKVLSAEPLPILPRDDDPSSSNWRRQLYAFLRAIPKHFTPDNVQAAAGLVPSYSIHGNGSTTTKIDPGYLGTLATDITSGTEIFSVEFWFRESPSMSSGELHTVFGWHDNSTGGLFKCFIEASSSTARHIEININRASTTRVYSNSGNTWTQDHDWHHVVIQVDVGSRTSEIYLDGVSKTTNETSGAVTANSWTTFTTDPFLLFNMTAGLGSLSGTARVAMDEMVIYSGYNWTAAEALHHYHAGRSNKESYKYFILNHSAAKNSIVAYWGFDNKSGEPNVEDSSGNGHTGVLTAGSSLVQYPGIF